MSRPCEIESREYGFACSNPCVALVTYFTDGNGAKAACGIHLAKAIEEVASDAHLYGSEPLRVIPAGKLSDRIKAARDR